MKSKDVRVIRPGGAQLLSIVASACALQRDRSHQHITPRACQGIQWSCTQRGFLERLPPRSSRYAYPSCSLMQMKENPYVQVNSTRQAASLLSDFREKAAATLYTFVHVTESGPENRQVISSREILFSSTTASASAFGRVRRSSTEHNPAQGNHRKGLCAYPVIVPLLVRMKEAADLHRRVLPEECEQLVHCSAFDRLELV